MPGGEEHCRHRQQSDQRLPSLWDEFPAGNRPNHRGRSAYRQHQGAGDRAGQQEYEVLNHRQYPPGRRPDPQRQNKGKIALQWKAVPGAKQYVLYRRDGSTRGKYRRVATRTGTRYIDTAPKRGKTAAYRLVAQTKTNGVTAQSPVARAAVRIKG